MLRQMQQQCSACNGQGKRIPPGKECKTCGGKKVVKEKKVLEVALPRGAPNDHKIKFEGYADQHPGEEPGDIIFTCKQKVSIRGHL